MSSERFRSRFHLSKTVLTSVRGELVVCTRIVAAGNEEGMKWKPTNVNAIFFQVLHPSRLDLDAIELGRHFSKIIDLAD